jgi:hypothetical protein
MQLHTGERPAALAACSLTWLPLPLENAPVDAVASLMPPPENLAGVQLLPPNPEAQGSIRVLSHRALLQAASSGGLM